ncbi:competence protein ComK [Alkalihalobacillus sp. FSL R5-0424]
MTTYTPHIQHADDYEITQDTLLIKPFYDIEFSSVIMESNQTYYVKQTPLQLIKQACLTNGSSFDGRSTFSVSSLGIKSKPPILISESQAIIAAPTHSPSNPRCEWFFSRHVVAIDETSQEGKNGTQVTFRDRTKVFFEISHNQFLGALTKAHRCQAFLQNFQ